MRQRAWQQKIGTFADVKCRSIDAASMKLNCIPFDLFLFFIDDVNVVAAAWCICVYNVRPLAHTSLTQPNRRASTTASGSILRKKINTF